MPFIVSDAHVHIPRCERRPGSLAPVIQALDAIQGKTGPSPVFEEGICYAVSRDGIRWEKPELGLVEFNGSKKNNIVVRQYHGPGIFKDLRDHDPKRRYKMFFLDQTGTNAGAKQRGHSVTFSSDGLHWSSPLRCPKIGGVYDAAHSAFWAPDLGKYVGFMRMNTHGRAIGRTESADFENWTESILVLHGTDYIQVPAKTGMCEAGCLRFKKQVYSMPVFRYGGVYLGLPAIYDIGDGRQTDLVQTELAWSPDSIQWHRICPGTPLIPPGPMDLGAAARVPKDTRSYDWGCIYAADAPVVLQDEIRIYYNGSNGPHTDWRDGFFCLAILRPDGFAGYEPSDTSQTGIIITNPLKCTGKNLRVTADVKGGALDVSVLGDEQTPVSHTTTADVGVVRWKNGIDLTGYQGKPIRIKFELKLAKLYSFNFSG
jgi:hypothetical protein